MGMVVPSSIQVYHSFLARSPHCMVVVKMWPYSGRNWLCDVCVGIFFVVVVHC